MEKGLEEVKIGHGYTVRKPSSGLGENVGWIHMVGQLESMEF